ncbi:porin [Beijerinckiaceae bacterium]|nr:porin [Beijerinckiaceae bacterium]
MTRVKGLLLGSAAALTWVIGTSGARAADLPVREAAPIEYVRICDAYGAGFFYIPGTETCLRVGGLVLTELRGFDPSYSILGPSFYANGTPRPIMGYVPSPSQYSNARSRDATHFNALGRVELDARTKSPWGALRAFARVDAYYGSGGNSARGSLAYLSPNVFNTSAGSTAQRETTIVNKAFIQFAGLTAGRAQSMFDFYADAYNYAPLRGSNATVALLAYTATFDGGFSASISFEDQPSRRVAIGSTIASTAAAAINVGGITGTSFQAQPAGARMPEIVGNLRLDQPWGAVQVSAAAHQVRASLFGATALATPPTAYAFPAMVNNSYGFAVQGGIQLKADFISPGDKFWLQAAYEKGAFGYVAGTNLGFNYGAVNANRYAGDGFVPMDYGYGWNPQSNSDCIFTGSRSCEQQAGWDVTAAYKHYWIPTLSSAIFGSYLQVDYSQNALNGFGGAVGVSNLKESRVGTNLVWTPLKGFDIGTELTYIHLNQTRPVGLAPDFGPGSLTAAGLPKFKANASEYEGRLRVQRAF